jgi:DNA-binding XRE family transcriptional regulator
MDEVKCQWLEAAGFRVGDTTEFLELSPQDVTFIEMKLSLSKRLKQVRLSQNMSQETLAKKIKSSQSRVAKMEAGDPSVSLDLLIRSLFEIGVNCEEVAMDIAFCQH